jgi:Raf kinase inhibitor-like YbhB/YbcL family protein
VRVAVLLAMATSLGCTYSLNVDPCHIRCDSDQQCPASMTCNTGYCEPPGTGARCGGDAAAPPGPFTISSSDFSNGGIVTVTYASCASGGNNVSPPLTWTAGPTDTQGYVVTAGENMKEQWVVWNLPASTRSLPMGVPKGSALLAPVGARQINSVHQPEYYGPCPQSGQSDYYYFRVIAVNVLSLDVPATPEVMTVVAEATLHKVGGAETYANFVRP